MKVEGVPRRMVGAMAHILRPYLAEFTEGGRYTVEDRLDQIAAGDRQCWLVMDGINIRAVALTQISSERFKTCWITHLTGEGLLEWAGAFEEIEAWAKSLGCARIEAVARPGYERIGKRFGLKKTHVLLAKDI